MTGNVDLNERVVTEQGKRDLPEGPHLAKMSLHFPCKTAPCKTMTIINPHPQTVKSLYKAALELHLFPYTLNSVSYIVLA